MAKPDPLSAEIVKTYRDILQDDDAPMHLKLGAAKALDAHQARKQDQPEPVTRDDDDELLAPDPFSDLDELETRRRKRAR